MTVDSGLLFGGHPVDSAIKS